MSRRTGLTFLLSKLRFYLGWIKCKKSKKKRLGKKNLPIQNSNCNDDSFRQTSSNLKQLIKLEVFFFKLSLSFLRFLNFLLINYKIQFLNWTIGSNLTTISSVLTLLNSFNPPTTWFPFDGMLIYFLAIGIWWCYNYLNYVEIQQLWKKIDKFSFLRKTYYPVVRQWWSRQNPKSLMY